MAADLVEASIWRDVKVPKGSGDRGSSRTDLKGKPQRAIGVEAARTGANRIWRRSRKAERAAYSSGLGAKYQARNIDPGIEAPETGHRYRRAKGLYERPAPIERSCGALESVNPEAVKAASGERTGDAPGTFDCTAQYRACRW